MCAKSNSKRRSLQKYPLKLSGDAGGMNLHCLQWLGNFVSSVLSAKPSVLSANHSVLPTKHNVLSTNLDVLSTEPRVLSAKPSVLSPKPIVLPTKHNVLSTNHNVLSTEPSVLLTEPPFPYSGVITLHLQSPNPVTISECKKLDNSVTLSSND